jgi:aspartate aminotransferase
MLRGKPRHPGTRRLGAVVASLLTAGQPGTAMPDLADRLNDFSLAASVTMTQRAAELARAGVRVISLAVGEPDFPTPLHAIEAARDAAIRGETKYPPQDGLPVLKEAVRRKFLRDNGLDYALDEIMVGNGGKQIIADALLATVNPGEEVVIPAPYWISYADMARLAGGVPVFVNCPQNNGFKLRPEDLEPAITPRTKWLILNSPNNPTGAALSRDGIAAIAAVMLRHPHVWVMTDDMYEHMLYDVPFHTIAAVEPGLRDRTLTLNGASKTYA